MARKKVDAKDVSLRIPVNTLSMAQEMADIEGLPVATWMAQVISSHVRHFSMQMANVKAASVLDTMMEHLAQFEAAGGVGMLVTPPPTNNNVQTSSKKTKFQRATRT